MENQGFEEEHQPRIEEAATFSQRSLPRHESRIYSFRSPGIDLLFDPSVSNSDGHVYEDILPGVEDVSTFSRASDRDPRRSNANNVQRSFDIVDYVSREAAGSLDREGISGFRRNLTLPFRRGAGLDPSAASSSVRVTDREKRGCQDDAEVAEAGNGTAVDGDDDEHDDAAFSPREIAARAQSIEYRPNRRRRKKDCKHCRSKAAAAAAAAVTATTVRECEIVDDRENDEHQRVHDRVSSNSRIILDPCNLGTLSAGSPAGGDSPTVYAISEKPGESLANTVKLIEYERNPALATEANNKEENALIGSEKSRPGMRVNSIYSQDRWYAKEAAIFCTDVKGHGSFQRAYSLPVRTQTPSSQNRLNLRRSVRGEPPPHPARLRKHRHGWTLHLARPLEASGCTRSLVLLLILVLTLLGIGAVALYIVFEPEKLQMIQQYLKSSASNSSTDRTLSAGSFHRNAIGDQRSDSSTTTTTTTTTTAAAASVSNSTPIASVLSSDDQSFPESTPPVSEPETETPSSPSHNSTRYCDDCLAGEVCVALADEEVPVCRIGLDREDPTGCAGFCVVNKQRCHRLDVDAFRCAEVEHYCLDDEWTCSNTLCIPLDKHCDGHMNCYDHSDEYNCVCDLETHFQCGNETSCLPLEKRCDGKIDCWDAADEINCTLGRNLGRSCPSENEFTCSNGQCIAKARFCDGLPDCADGSDEPHGCQGRCNKHEFTCQNSRCIAKGMKCNGIDDCGDGTDERHCKDRIF